MPANTTPSSHPARRVSLRSMPAAQAQLARRLASGLIWKATQGPWQCFELRRSALPAAGAVEAGFALRNAHGELQIEEFTLLQIASGIALDPAWPAAVMHDMLQLAWGMVDDDLRQALGGDATCSTQPVAAASDDVHLLLTLCGSNGFRHSAALRCPAASALPWLHCDGWQAGAPPACPAVDALPCHGRLWLGTSHLTARTLRTLRPGDAVRIAMQYYGSDNRVRIKLGRHALIAYTASDGTLYFDSWRSASMEHDSTEWESEIDGADAPVALDDLPIRVDFVAGHANFTVNELRSLASGAVIELSMPARPAVDIVANGRRIGSGELIEVDGTLAVEIIKLEGGA
ncbi:type III secretion system cytoplasmic ring protein SctQ [Pseudoduganella sp. R-43]|uniref:type III secretion system cytoplasmic ring protein SctQ n=1 Tax=unclassified Pseudoduganella TaxID=2637179 RepID=UPI003CF07CE2